MVLHPVAQIEVYSMCNLGASNCSFLPQAKQVSKQIKMWFDTDEGFTKMNESGDKKN